jgi:hypothetical protein
MSRRTTTRYLLGTIAGLAIVGVSTAGAMALAGTDTQTAGAALATITVAAGSTTAPVTVTTSGARVLVTTVADAADESSTSSPGTTTSGPSGSSSGRTSAASTADTSVATTSSQTTGEYTDGTYTATGSYSTPGGSESITVTVTLSRDVVSTVSATGTATDGTASQFQAQFLSAYSSEVVGKSIDAVSLSRVAGSSLTSQGFNAAIQEIRSDAKA